MTQLANQEIDRIVQQNRHLQSYLKSIEDKYGIPSMYQKIPSELKKEKYPNIIYTTKGQVFIHIYRSHDMQDIKYHAIAPLLSKKEEKKRDLILERMYERAHLRTKIKTQDDLRRTINEVIDEVTIEDDHANTKEVRARGKIPVTAEEKMSIRFDITKNIVGGGPLEPFMRDPYIEDIHILTGKDVHLIHKVFGMIRTNVYIDEKWASTFSQEFSEKIGSPVSEGQPIADGTLPDGSRVNIIHSNEISIKGPSMTVRKFSETPISVTQLINWGTISSGIAAYLWLALQYGRSFFVCGETASGKTTTTNALIPFIPPNKKIYTAENTPEIKVPQPVWQQLLTRTTGPKESHVDLNDLLKAALRSRPNYIIPGETRGIEGRVVFQAMQTGHPVITTFHAGSVTKVIQRFTGEPIKVPKTFMDNLDFVLIQMAVERKGVRLRRVLSLDEIEGYNRAVDGVISRTAFTWDAATDKHTFKANRNSYILEQRIAKTAGYMDTSGIYDEYEVRKHILERMVEEEIFDYYDVLQCIWSYYREGVEGLPITL